MEALHCPNNIKVHFAAGEVQNQFIAARLLGVSYSLYTCYPFVERMVFDKSTAPIMALKWMTSPAVEIPTYINQSSFHTIQDSGLFTLMFGSQKSVQKDERLLNKWYDALLRFTVEHGQPVTCVEIDCQRLLGPEKAWEFRHRMRRDLPQKNRMINVFHLPDGQKGLDRLIEYSDYIAISVPELRFAGKKDFVFPIASYIKRKKPSIDIHLLGCTDLSLLRKCRFATSADSTSWVSGKRFGFLKGRHVRTLNHEKVVELIQGGVDTWNKIAEYNKPENADCLCAQIEILKEEYQNAAGPQDYYKALKNE